MKGTKPRPSAVINITNDKQGKRSKAEIKKREETEPHIKSDLLKCPTRLSSAAAEEWHRIVSLYKEFENQIMNDLDEDALTVYCEALIMYKIAMEKVKETAAVYKSPKDAEPKINPWLKVANDSSTTMRAHSDLLLLNPVARARAGLAIMKASEENLSPIAKFLKGRAENGDV